MQPATNDWNTILNAMMEKTCCFLTSDWGQVTGKLSLSSSAFVTSHCKDLWDVPVSLTSLTDMQSGRWHTSISQLKPRDVTKIFCSVMPRWFVPRDHMWWMRVVTADPSQQTSYITAIMCLSHIAKSIGAVIKSSLFVWKSAYDGFSVSWDVIYIC